MRRQRALIERLIMVVMVAAVGPVTSTQAAQTPPPLSRAPQCPLNPLSRSNTSGAAIIPAPYLMAVHPVVDTHQFPQFHYYAPYGWLFKYVWFINHRFRDRAVITGGTLGGGAPLWFADDVHRRATRVLVLDVRHYLHAASRAALDQNGFHSGMYFPRAGCYQIDAAWPGGHWRATFSAGE